MGSYATGFQGNVISCDGISRVWKYRQLIERMREGGLDNLPFRLDNLPFRLHKISIRDCYIQYTNFLPEP